MYRLSECAAVDFARIYDYTFLNFGEIQADKYLDMIEAFFETVAEMPHLGRDYPDVPGVMRVEFQRHTIFYTVRHTDIFIVRILHQQMHPTRHLL